jgi:multicomponent Na+:H+ antiporter subunit D
MTTITIASFALPLFMGFSIYLLPKFDRYLTLGVAIFSSAYGFYLILTKLSFAPQLLDNFGVTLLVDELSGYFILTNGLVTAAVVCYCWQQNKSAFFYTQAAILHGSVNATFLCNDFISLYVALEVIGIASCLLVAYTRTDRSIWVALRYLFIGNTAMLFYLVGVALVYQAHHSFAFTGLRGSPPEAIALILMAILAKAGVFILGLWLPLTHSEAESPVSALLSAVVVKAGIFPLVRIALMMPELDPLIRILGMGSAILGVTYALFEKDTKRTLAFSTISQLGFILAAPFASGFYVLTHGLVKSSLFLIAGKLPSRKFSELQNQGISPALWVPLAIAGLSISGFPLLAGFGAKVVAMKNLLPWQEIPMNVAAVGTAIYFAKFIFLPHQRQLVTDTGPIAPQLLHQAEDPKVGNLKSKQESEIPLGFWFAMSILIGGLILANGFDYKAYTLANMGKSLVTVGIGWAAYLILFKRVALKLPRTLEKLEHLAGVMSLMLIALFWMVLGVVMP